MSLEGAGREIGRDVRGAVIILEDGMSAKARWGERAFTGPLWSRVESSVVNSEGEEVS